MADSRNKWLYRGGIGCLILLVAGTISVGSLWVMLKGLTDRGVETREALDATYPSQEAFTPFPDGTIPPDRVERFMAVRRRLLIHCEIFSRHQSVFGRMEHHEKTEEDPSAGEFSRDVRDVVSSLWRLGRDVGEYAIDRNRILLEHEMGLGEYTWIYTVVYHAWLGQPPSDLIEQDKPRTKIFHGRVLAEIKSMMRRHIEDLEASLVTPSGDPAASARIRRRVADWQAELDRLDRDENRLPFQDGLPTGLEASLEPFRAELARVYCPATSELDLMKTVDTGLWYDHR